ncbi:MAG: hypothetical protein EG824_13905 [Deltaproteobacteria bacterium]|nr:hypothetical protein [Deltaproteobacteria bacterium]
MGIGIPELLVIFVIGSIPGILALIDILRSEFTGSNKLVWLLVVFLFPFVGAIAYLAIGRKQKIS